MYQMFFSYTVFDDEYYVISRTTNDTTMVDDVEIIDSTRLSDFDRLQYVPRKAYTKLGLEYFCTIEMTDSTFIVDYTDYYLGNFKYEGVRFYVWNLVEATSDSTFTPISKLN